MPHWALPRRKFGRHLEPVALLLFEQQKEQGRTRRTVGNRSRGITFHNSVPGTLVSHSRAHRFEIRAERRQGLHQAGPDGFHKHVASTTTTVKCHANQICTAPHDRLPPPTVEMILDFRKVKAPPSPLTLIDSPTPVSIVDSFRFLGTTITQDLQWEPTISSLIKKAQQRMYFLRQLKKLKVPTEMLVLFYSAIIESILTSSITVWFPGATVRDKHRLQRIVRAAEKVIGCKLPSLQDLQDQEACGSDHS
ncbi:uncharacterized protein LOC133639301 isoform X2 [Entelurus aequoreus]|uniref:uncharacterized protein LOC133639301 isoform X2 n=1 Tax=Entelurus aequoreus TaxID=161455 RepID=UPI002B1D163E|nr:uncharacterized protein LOC133639301 isoform X2 [Entelurus aequoreus]